MPKKNIKRKSIINYQYKSPEAKSWYKVIVLLSLLFFVPSFAPFLKNQIILGHDIQLHLVYLRKFQDAFFAGQFPVRMIDWFIPGFNQPLFNFYQPGFYYLSLIPKFLGLTDLGALNVTLIFLWATSAILMFLFTRRHFGNLGGILAGYLYLIAPYHLLDIFVRVALPELAALSFMPGVFWALKSYFDTRKGYYLTLMSFFVALASVSHPPTIIMFAPLFLFYIGYLLYIDRSYLLLGSILASFLIGFGIISFFLIPAFFEQQYIQTVFLRTGYYDFHNHFVCLQQLFIPFWDYGTSAVGCSDGISFQLGLMHWLVVILIISLFVIKFIFKKADSWLPKSIFNLSSLNNKKYILFITFLIPLFLSLYMTLSATQFIWETLPYLQYIQYPWRFLSVAIFSSSFLAGGLLLVFSRDSYKYGVYVAIILLSALSYGSYIKPVAYATADQVYPQSGVLKLTETDLEKFVPEPGYMPKWTQILPAGSDRPKDEIKIASDSASINSSSLSAAFKQYDITASKSTPARFYTHFFPGWKIFIDNKEYQPNFDNIYGYMDVTIPTGRHKVVLVFANTFVRSVANNLSVSFLLVSLLLGLFFPSGKQKSH